MCLTSNFEGLPMSLMEGQQYGVIPVSFDSYAGIREITCDGACGIMVPSYSLRKYAALLNAALADTELQERMRTRALEASRRYDLENIGNQWLAFSTKCKPMKKNSIYQRALRSRHQRRIGSALPDACRKTAG